MTAIRDLFADFDVPARTPVGPACQPIAPDPEPTPPIRQPAELAKAWAYKPLRGVPPDMIIRACLCGAIDESPGPSLDDRACWKCGKLEAMRPLPWRPTAAEIAAAAL